MKVHRMKTIQKIRSKWANQKLVLNTGGSEEEVPLEHRMTPQDWDEVIMVLEAQQDLIKRQAKNLSNVRKGNRDLVRGNRRLNFELNKFKNK